MSPRSQAAAEWLATPGRPIIGQLDRIPFKRGEASSAATLDRTLSALECQTENIYSAGDPDLVVGRALAPRSWLNDTGRVHRNSEFIAVPKQKYRPKTS